MTSIETAIASLSVSADNNSSNNTEPIIHDEQVLLSSGQLLHVISSFPTSVTTDKPIVVFLHGSYMAAWCYMEKFIPYFNTHGYGCMALSWEGTAKSPYHPSDSKNEKVKFMNRVRNLQIFMNDHYKGIIQKHVPNIDITDDNNTNNVLFKPVIVAHSMAALVVMKYIELESSTANTSSTSNEPLPLKSRFSGIVCMAPMPPGGMNKMKSSRSMVDTYTVLRGLVMKGCFTNISLCRKLYFGGDAKNMKDEKTGKMKSIKYDYGISDSIIKRYQQNMIRDGQVAMDISDMDAYLPSIDKATGKAPFVLELPRVLVLGGGNADFLVDEGALKDTATYFGLSTTTTISSGGSENGLVIIPDAPHLLMLAGDNVWKHTADTILQWLLPENQQPK